MMTRKLIAAAMATSSALVLGACSSESGAPGAAASAATPQAPFATQATSSSCTTPPAPSTLVGWAAVSGSGVTTTTGGGSAAPQTVTTLAALQSAVRGTAPAVIYVQGALSPGKISVGSNKTIVGLCGAELHGHLELAGSVNVIIRNVKIVGYGVGSCALDPSYDPAVGCSSGDDAISVQKNAHHVWFDHCDISDGTDGNLDITNGANHITVSWTKFHYTPRTDNSGTDATGASGHRFSDLVGGTDSPSTYPDATTLNVTWHHNWWADNVVERQARVRFGKNHFFNNVWSSSTSSYCVRAGKQATIHLEANYFSAQKNPHVFNSTTDQKTASITAANNTYASCTGTQATGGGGTAWTPSSSYGYTPDSAATAYSQVTASAGPQ
jgi:pectate lyase